MQYRNKFSNLILLLFFAFEPLCGSCKHDHLQGNTFKAISVKYEPKRETLLPPEKYKSRNLDEIGWELCETEGFGEIKIKLSAEMTVKIIGEAEKRSKMIEWGADAEYHQSWYYPKQGIELDIIGKDRAHQSVNMITVKSPCSLKTKRWIGIGSSIKEVREAYKKAIDPVFSSYYSIVAGSIYGGMIFNFKKGKVTSIFIGAAAE